MGKANLSQIRFAVKPSNHAVVEPQRFHFIDAADRLCCERKLGEQRQHAHNATVGTLPPAADAVHTVWTPMSAQL